MKQQHRLEPAFIGEDSAIVFAANDSFCPYLSVMLYSVIEHSSPDRYYDIVILHRDISQARMERMEKLADGKANIIIRFFCVADRITGHDLFIGGKDNFTIDTYLRLLIPWTLSDRYKKALYLDGDMLALDDVAPLLDTELGGFLLASSRDYCGLEEYYRPDSYRKTYRDTELKLSAPDDYFLNGMLLLNLDAFRAEFTEKGLLKLCASRPWLQHDQDVLNLLCSGGRAKLLHGQWDVMLPGDLTRIPAGIQEEIRQASEHPKILHFGGDEKPWLNEKNLWLETFWDVAPKTPFYHEIVRHILRQSRYSAKDWILQEYCEGRIGFRYILRYTGGWLHYKLSRIGKKHIGRRM